MTMTSPTLATAPSPLDRPPTRFARRPFYAETLTLLRGLRDNDLETMHWLCDHDFGAVDVDTDGSPRMLRTHVESERWFHELFATLDGLDGSLDFEILGYKATKDTDLGISVLEYRQYVTIADRTTSIDCAATIVWKRTERGWRQTRWHASAVSTPDHAATEPFRSAA